MSGLTRLVIDSYRHKYDYQKSIDRLTLEIEAINEEMYNFGLTRTGIVLTEEQLRSNLPMPKTVSPTFSHDRLLDLIERKAEKEAQIDALTMSLQQADVVKKLSVEDQRLMQDLYHSCRSAEDVACDHGYSKRGMYKHINAAIEKLIH